MSPEGRHAAKRIFVDPFIQSLGLYRARDAWRDERYQPAEQRAARSLDSGFMSALFPIGTRSYVLPFTDPTNEMIGGIADSISIIGAVTLGIITFASTIAPYSLPHLFLHTIPQTGLVTLGTKYIYNVIANAALNIGSLDLPDRTPTTRHIHRPRGPRR